MKPNNQAAAEGLDDAQVLEFLVKNPNAVRRPMVEVGGVLTLGFRPDARKALEAALKAERTGKPPPRK